MALRLFCALRYHVVLSTFSSNETLLYADFFYMIMDRVMTVALYASTPCLPILPFVEQYVPRKQPSPTGLVENQFQNLHLHVKSLELK